jgi:hypothetical protein
MMNKYETFADIFASEREIICFAFATDSQVIAEISS